MFEKGHKCQQFGEHISHLVLCGNWMHSDVLSNMGPEEVDFLVDVFGSRLVLGIICNLQGTTIVLKDSAMNLCSSGVDGASKLPHFCLEELWTCSHILLQLWTKQ